MRKHKLWRIATLSLILHPAVTTAQFQILHSFDGTTAGGGGPSYAPTLVGNTLYGYANQLVYSIGLDGTGFTPLYSFTGTDGNTTNFVSDGNVLYSSDYGKGIYQINLDGSNFSILSQHSFDIDITLSQGIIYGYEGEFNIASDSFSPIMNMDAGFGGPTVSGSTIYYMNENQILKINTDGTGKTLLYTFNSSTDGSQPYGSLLLDGNTLYGLNSYGGSSHDAGTIFKINTDGSGFQVMHVFTSGNDGNGPQGSLVISGDTLYGMTQKTLFEINIDGSDYQILHQFMGGINDGLSPERQLTLVGNTLYGVTAEGGAFGESSGLGYGTIFSYTLPEPASGGIGMAGLFMAGVGMGRRR